jgi:hypothetical protein
MNHSSTAPILNFDAEIARTSPFFTFKQTHNIYDLVPSANFVADTKRPSNVMIQSVAEYWEYYQQLCLAALADGRAPENALKEITQRVQTDFAYLYSEHFSGQNAGTVPAQAAANAEWKIAQREVTEAFQHAQIDSTIPRTWKRAFFDAAFHKAGLPFDAIVQKRNIKDCFWQGDKRVPVIPLRTGIYMRHVLDAFECGVEITHQWVDKTKKITNTSALRM